MVLENYDINNNSDTSDSCANIRVVPVQQDFDSLLWTLGMKKIQMYVFCLFDHFVCFISFVHLIFSQERTYIIYTMYTLSYPLINTIILTLSPLVLIPFFVSNYLNTYSLGEQYLESIGQYYWKMLSCDNITNEFLISSTFGNCLILC